MCELFSFLSKWGSVIGLVFDIIGATFVAYEVVNQYHGKKFEPQIDPDIGIAFPPKETKEYLIWNIRKYFWMKIGLLCLIIGFTLQIIGSWPN